MYSSQRSDTQQCEFDAKRCKFESYEPLQVKLNQSEGKLCISFSLIVI